MKTNKLLLCIVLLCFSMISFAQSGLQGIIVERYYQANQADVDNAIAEGAVTPLTTSSVTYRIYVDMAPNYKFNSLWGSSTNNLKVNSTAPFFNDPGYGVTVNPGTISAINIRKNTAMLDSYFTTGGAGGGKVGVLKIEDTDGSVGNAQGILANNPGGCFGLPITGVGSQDGVRPLQASPATYISTNVLGILSAFDAIDQTDGNSIVLNNHAIAALGGVYGPTSTNMVLVAQFTTSGELSFELNLQIQNFVTGIAENYAANNPPTNYFTHPALTRVGGAPTGLACYQQANINPVTCEYVVTGSQPAVPTLACYETLGSFNTSTCSWNVSGTQPTQPTTACYETATFSTSACAWVVTGTQTTNTTAQTSLGSYTWANNGQTYTTSGTYTGNTVGCVIQVLNLTIDPFYQVVPLTQTCDVATYCVSVATSPSYTVDNVKGYDVVLNYDASKFAPTGNITVSNNLINPSFVETASLIQSPGVLNIIVNLNGTAPASTEFNGQGNIFCVEFTRLAGLLAIDSSLFAVPVLNESYITGVSSKLVKSNSVYSTSQQNYIGNLVFWLDQSPIAYNTASPSSFLLTSVSGTSGSPVTPNTAGQFTHNLSNGTSISINRDVENTNSVQLILNAADAVIGKTLLLNSPSFIPTVSQIIALDVNLDGVVSAGDISQMKQRTTLSIPEFMQAWNYNTSGVSNGSASKDWIFVDASRLTSPAYLISSTFPNDNGVGFSKSRVPSVPSSLGAVVSNYTSNNSTCPTIGTETYNGIMLGDVNGSYASYVADGILKSDKNKITIDLNQVVIDGGNVTVPVILSSDEAINALDLAFMFDESKLTFNNISELGAGIDAESHFNLNDRTLRFSANKLDNFSLNQSVALVTFQSADGTINKKDFSSLMGLLNGKPVDVVFEKSGIISPISNISIYPNPSNGSFSVLSAEDLSIEILEMSGKLLKNVSVKSNLEQVINLDNVSTGVYLLKSFNETSSSTQRIVIQK